jgi:hypothetical protein
MRLPVCDRHDTVIADDSTGWIAAAANIFHGDRLRMAICPLVICSHQANFGVIPAYAF